MDHSRNTTTAETNASHQSDQGKYRLMRCNATLGMAEPKTDGKKRVKFAKFHMLRKRKITPEHPKSILKKTSDGALMRCNATLGMTEPSIDAKEKVVFADRHTFRHRTNFIIRPQSASAIDISIFIKEQLQKMLEELRTVGHYRKEAQTIRDGTAN